MSRFGGFLFLGLLAGCARVAPPTYPMPHPVACTGSVNLSVLGDSLARGWGASQPRFTLVNRIFGHINQYRTRSHLYNFGVPGATTREIIARQLPSLRPHPCSVIFIVSGANEVQHYDRPGAFENDYARLLDAIRSRDPNAAIVAAGVPDVSLARRIPLLIKPVVSALAAMDNGVVLNAAARHGAFSIDYFAISRRDAAKHLSAYTSADGMHPSNAGYAAMAAAAYPVFDRALRR